MNIKRLFVSGCRGCNEKNCTYKFDQILYNLIIPIGLFSLLGGLFGFLISLASQ